MLLLGPPGAGKSDLLLRLLDRGWALVADDQVRLAPAGPRGIAASAPPALAGLLEVRGLGILGGWPVLSEAPLRLVAELRPARDIPRLPEARAWEWDGRALPFCMLDAAPASAPARLEAALDLALGRLHRAEGAPPASKA